MQLQVMDFCGNTVCFVDWEISVALVCFAHSSHSIALRLNKGMTVCRISYSFLTVKTRCVGSTLNWGYNYGEKLSFKTFIVLLGQNCGSGGEHMLCMQKFPGLIPCTSNEKDQVAGDVKDSA